MNARLVAIAEHGLVPSVQAAHMTRVPGPRVVVLRHLDQHAGCITIRFLPVNVPVAVPAVILDAGWPLAALGPCRSSPARAALPRIRARKAGA